MQPRFEGKALLVIGPVLFLFAALAVMIALVFSQFHALTDAEGWVVHTVEVQAGLNALSTELGTAQAAERAYLLTGADRYKTQLGVAASNAPMRLNAVQLLTLDNPAQQERIAALEQIVKRKLQSLADSVALRSSGQREAAVAQTAAPERDTLDQQIDSLIAQMETAEEKLLLERRDRSASAHRKTQMLFAEASATSIAAILLASIMISRELKARRNAEDQLLRTNERLEERVEEQTRDFRQLAENIPQLAWMTHPGGDIFWYNQRWFDYTGTDLEQMKGWGWQKVHHPEHVERVTDRFRKAIETGEPWEDTFPLRGRDGSYRWFLSRAFPIRNADGRIARWFGTNTDITGLRNAQEALRASEERYRVLSQELEQRVEERTEQLTKANAQLTDANEKLKEVDRLKSEFLATMSHELRTPLNSIIGFSEIIAAGLAGPVNEEQKRQLGMALGSARHLLQIINDLLDLARIESGKLEVVRSSFPLREVVQQVVETLRPLANRKNLSLETEVPEGARIFTDRKMIFQILLNLANNGVKFTERGKVRIVAEITGKTLRMAVSDTGIGIQKQNLGELFEAFRQVDGSARRRFEGTGLGLYLCKRLVGLLGGEISVESVYGLGSTFTVTLPLAEQGE
jgi:PAS domain S-box-containing protein